MKSLEFLHSDSTYFGTEIDRANRNFVKIAQAITTLESKYSHDKGWYPSIERLNLCCPSGSNGDFAYVKGEYYYWTSRGWQASGILAESSQTGDLYPHLDEKLPVYYRGDSVRINLGSIEQFKGAHKMEANIFLRASNRVTAYFPKVEGYLDIRQDTLEDLLYFIIPENVTKSMDLGEQTLEMAAWFSTGVPGEDYVKRSRWIIFELQEFETIK